MKKNIYIAPSIKLRVIEVESLMAAISQGISDDPAKGPGKSKAGLVEDDADLGGGSTGPELWD